MASEETFQPRPVVEGVMATSTTVALSTGLLYSSEARISPVRRVKRSRSTVPPRRCAPSMDISAIRPKLTKMLRRCSVTTSPRARGASPWAAGRRTTSRTRPIDVPSLSSSGRPRSRDVKTCWAVISGDASPRCPRLRARPAPYSPGTRCAARATGRGNRPRPPPDQPGLLDDDRPDRRAGRAGLTGARTGGGLAGPPVRQHYLARYGAGRKYQPTGNYLLNDVHPPNHGQ